jgi:hypothetical protein
MEHGSKRAFYVSMHRIFAVISPFLAPDHGARVKYYSNILISKERQPLSKVPKL